MLFKTLAIFSTPRQASSTRPWGCPDGCAQWPVAQAWGMPAWHSQRSRHRRHGRACRPRCGRTHPGHGVSDGSSSRSIRLLLFRVGGRRGRWRRGRLMRTEGRRRGSPRQAFEHALTDFNNLVGVPSYPCPVAKKPMLQIQEEHPEEKKTVLPSSWPMTRKFTDDVW